MKYKILIFAFIGLCVTVTAQKSSNKAFAITSENKGGSVWTEVKLIDLSTGQVVQNVFENSKPYTVFDARTNKSIKVKDDRGVVIDKNKLAFFTFSAACAYDKKHNRLYYTPMYINQLRYIDLNAKSPRVVYFEGENLSSAADLKDEANHITRMVIASDGNGYALSNDGSHLVRFTTGKRPVITDLGALTDDPADDKISIRNKYTGWGGDMIADAFGGLYLISAHRSVFKIDVKSRMATYLGKIEGLPGNFTTNGAVIDDNGELIVSSANSTNGYYKVDMNNWEAEKLQSENKESNLQEGRVFNLQLENSVFNASDLANGNLAFQDKANQRVPRLISRSIVRNDKIATYPNPVTQRIFRVSFDNNLMGRYDIQLVDLFGRTISQKIVSVGNEGQVEEVTVSDKIAKGIYLVKVLNHSRKTVFADRIFVD